MAVSQLIDSPPATLCLTRARKFTPIRVCRGATRRLTGRFRWTRSCSTNAISIKTQSKVSAAPLPASEAAENGQVNVFRQGVTDRATAFVPGREFRQRDPDEVNDCLLGVFQFWITPTVHIDRCGSAQTVIPDFVPEFPRLARKEQKL